MVEGFVMKLSESFGNVDFLLFCLCLCMCGLCAFVYGPYGLIQKKNKWNGMNGTGTC